MGYGFGSIGWLWVGFLSRLAVSRSKFPDGWPTVCHLEHMARTVMRNAGHANVD